MITALRIENFKCWKDTGEFRLAPITGFFGTNSSGKTSLLQFLLMLKQTVDSRDRNQILNFGGSEKDYVDLGTLNDILYHTEHDEQARLLKWMIQWQVPAPLEEHFLGFQPTETFSSDQIRFEASVEEGMLQDTPYLYVQKFDYYVADKHSAFSYRLGMQRGQNAKYHIFEDSSKHLYDDVAYKAVYNPFKSYGFPSLPREDPPGLPPATLFEGEFEWLFKPFYYLGPLREYPARQYIWGGGEPSDVGTRGKNAVPALLASRLRTAENGATVEQKVATWLKRLGLIHSFKIEEIAKDTSLYIARVQQSPDSAFVPITDVGFGVSQVLPVLTLCYYVPQGSIVILEQPEIHLHPSVQSGLADVFIEVAKERNLQIILESHSEHLLTRLQRRIAERKFEANDAALYFCHREQSDARLTPLQLDEYGNIINWPQNFFGDELGERAAMMLAELERKEREATG